MLHIPFGIMQSLFWRFITKIGNLRRCFTIISYLALAQYWGVPQRRKRIFLVGDYRAGRAAQILFEREGLLGYSEKSRAEEEVYPADITGGVDAASGGNIPMILPINEGVINGSANGFGVGNDGEPAPTLTGRDRHGIAVCYMPSGHGGYTEGIGTLRASAGPHGISSANIVVEPKAYSLSGFGGFAEGIGTLRANGGNNGGGSETLIVESEVRKLTPLECERLQGFPDEWTRYADTGKEIADTPRYTALGNSLAVPCAERIFRGIAAFVEVTAQ